MFRLLNIEKNMGDFCLKRNDYKLSVSESFCRFREEKCFFDVTLVTEDDVLIEAQKPKATSSRIF